MLYATVQINGEVSVVRVRRSDNLATKITKSIVACFTPGLTKIDFQLLGARRIPNGYLSGVYVWDPNDKRQRLMIERSVSSCLRRIGKRPLNLKVTLR